MTSQMFNAIAAVTGHGQNPNATPAQWASSQYGYGGGSGGGSSAYHVSMPFFHLSCIIVFIGHGQELMIPDCFSIVLLISLLHYN